MEPKHLINAKRISILGNCGSGKSTLAQELGKMLNLPVHHIDKITYKPNWETKSREDVAEQVKQITEQEKWILEGNYTLTLDNRFKGSDIIIFLDFLTDFCIKSVKERESQLGLPDYLQSVKCNMDYVVNYVQRFETHVKPLIDTLIKRYKEKVVILYNRKEAISFIEDFKSLFNNQQNIQIFKQKNKTLQRYPHSLLWE